MSHDLIHPLPVVIPPKGGRTIKAFGVEISFHLTGEQTGGRSMLATIIAPEGDPGPPLHYHENEDETFHVLEGRMSFYMDGAWKEVAPGSIVFAPKKSIHSLKNVGDTTARVLVSAVPSGFEIFFDRCAQEFSRPGGPDMARIVEISSEHHIHYMDPGLHPKA